MRKVVDDILKQILEVNALALLGFHAQGMCFTMYVTTETSAMSAILLLRDAVVDGLKIVSYCWIVELTAGKF